MLRISRFGTTEIVVGLLVLGTIGVLLGWVWWPLSLLIFPVAIWLVAFFRDPDRVIPTDPRSIVSPADGVVSDVTPVEHDPDLRSSATRVGIFLNIFNVHVNRSPLDAKVIEVRYKKGKFVSALRHDQASTDNESNTIVLGDPTTGRPIAVVKQIAGLIARRIICTVKPGDMLTRGQRIGLIKFGSRTELTIHPDLNASVQVEVGQKVQGARDVVFVSSATDSIARLK